jgi:transcriptional regulator with XRE-family HTH domain
MNTTTARLAATIRNYIAAAGISQAELARRSGIPLTNLNRLLNSEGTEFSPQLETVEAIAGGLGLTVPEFLAGAVPKPRSRSDNPRSIAKDLGRLAEDFLLASDESRAEILELASNAARKASKANK